MLGGAGFRGLGRTPAENDGRTAQEEVLQLFNTCCTVLRQWFPDKKLQKNNDKDKNRHYPCR